MREQQLDLQAGRLDTFTSKILVAALDDVQNGHSLALAKGHRLLFQDQSMNNRVPKTKVPRPQPINFKPEVANANTQPPEASKTGNGYNQTLYGRAISGARFRRSTSATHWPMNWTTMRVMRRKSITVSKGRKLQTIDTAPMTSSEICGNCFVGWSRPKILKKSPFRAAA